MKQTKRTQRVAQTVRREVGSLLLTEGHGDELARVVITDCQVSPDLRIARLYFTVMEAEPEVSVEGGREGAIAEAKAALDRWRKHFRHRVGQVLRTKYTPELFFHFDDTLEQARRIEAVLEAVRPSDADSTPPEPT